MLLSGPVGGVVTQRTANPCTPVRFRHGPPGTKLLLFNDLSSRNFRAIAPIMRYQFPDTPSLARAILPVLRAILPRVSGPILRVTTLRIALASDGPFRSVECLSSSSAVSGRKNEMHRTPEIDGWEKSRRGHFSQSVLAMSLAAAFICIAYVALI